MFLKVKFSIYLNRHVFVMDGPDQSKLVPDKKCMAKKYQGMKPECM